MENDNELVLWTGAKGVDAVHKAIDEDLRAELKSHASDGIKVAILGGEPIQSTPNALTHANIERTLVEIISNHKPSDSNWISPEEFDAEKNRMYNHEIKVSPYLMNTWSKEKRYLYPELKSSIPSQEKRNKLRKKRKSKHK